MTLTTNHETANDPIFQAKVKVALFKACTLIKGEAPEVDKPVKHEKRQAFAHRMLSSPNVEGFSFAIVGANPSITSLSPDNDIEFMVNSVFDDMAGVDHADDNP